TEPVRRHVTEAGTSTSGNAVAARRALPHRPERPNGDPRSMSVEHTLDITGGVPLYGTVPVRGSKNAVPKLMVAALLTAQAVTIRNVSLARDISIRAS